MVTKQGERPIAAFSISVVCPTFNSQEFVGKAIASVLNQSVLPYELIISDDGSTDGTADLVERLINSLDLCCLLLRNEHRGPGAARNAGIRSATGEWIAFLDSDDFWEPEKLERIAEAIERHPDANFICHHETMIRKDGRHQALQYGLRYRCNRPLVRQVYASNIFSTSAVVCRRSLLLECGLFDEGLMSAQDYDLWLRLSPDIRPFFVEESLGYYVERAGNITSGNSGARMLNELRIATRHANMVPRLDYIMRVTRIFRSYARQQLFRFLLGPMRSRFAVAKQHSSGK